MKYMKNFLIIVCLLSTVFIISLGQTQYPSTCTVSASDIVIPWNQNSATGTFTINYGSNDISYYSYLNIAVTEGSTAFDGDRPNSGSITVSSLGFHRIYADMRWYDGYNYQSGPVSHADFYVTKGQSPPPSVSISGPTDVQHALSKYYPANSYTWTANVSNGTSPFTYSWKKDDQVVGNSSSYTEYFGYNGESGGYSTHTLMVEVVDNDNRSASASITVTEWNSGYQEE